MLVKKRRVHLRFKAWMRENFIGERERELNSLDLSQEKID